MIQLPEGFKGWGTAVGRILITIAVILVINYITTRHSNPGALVQVPTTTTADKVVESRIVESRDSLRILDQKLPVMKYEIVIKEKQIEDINAKIQRHYDQKISTVNDIDGRKADSIIANARFVPEW